MIHVISVNIFPVLFTPVTEIPPATETPPAEIVNFPDMVSPVEFTNLESDSDSV